jgi:hypothetical protein
VFARLSSSGLLYDHLLDRINAVRQKQSRPPMDRSTLKRRFLADVLAKKLVVYRCSSFDYPSEIEDVFRELFPTVWSFIRQVNRGGCKHENLIRELQRWESWLVVETVGGILCDRHDGFFVTLHDAIYAKPGFAETVKATFDEVFDRLHFRMRVKVE